MDIDELANELYVHYSSVPSYYISVSQFSQFIPIVAMAIRPCLYCTSEALGF